MALGPGPAGLKFWSPPGITADNTADINNLPASVGEQFNPWGRKRPVQDWVWGNPCLYPPSVPTTLSAAAGSYALSGSNAALTVTAVDTTNLPAGAVNWFNPWGRKRPVQDWFRGPIPAVPVILTAAGSSYTLTGGSAVTFAFGQVAAAGTYTLTGTAAALALGHVAGSGSYTLTGSNAGLALGLGAGAGSYTLTGTAAGFVLPFTLTAAAGSYTLTGADAAFVIPGVVTYLPAGMTGSYVPWRRLHPVALLTETSRVLSAAVPVTLTAAGGSYTLTGADAAFVIPGAVTYLPAGLTGNYVPWKRPYSVSLLTGIGRIPPAAPVTLTAGTSNYTLTGADAALTVSGVVTYLPAGMTGGYVPWRRPHPINLRTATGRPLAAPPVVLTAASGSYVLTGADAAFVIPGAVSYLPAGMTGGYVPWRRPYPVNLRTATGRPLAVGPITLRADAGSYTITGSSAAIALRLTANSGSYTVSGTAAVLARGFAAGAGAYAILGTEANLVQAGTITLACGAGSYTITGGADVSFLGVIPPTVEQPGGNYTGGVSRGRMIRRRKRGELDIEPPPDLEPPPLSPYPPDLKPPVPGPKPPDLLPPQPSLLASMPQVKPAKIIERALEDDEDEDEIALLLELLSRL